jgi:hypothetical protein
MIDSVNPLANFLMGITSGFSRQTSTRSDMYYTTVAG